MSILDDIYDGRYSVEHPAGDVSKEVLEQDTTFWEKVKGLLGEEAVEQQQARTCDISYAEEQTAFGVGCRLGTLLRLQVL